METHKQQPSTPKELADLFKYNRIRFRYEPIDPHRNDAIRYVNDNRKEIEQMVFEDTKLWEWAFELWVQDGKEDVSFASLKKTDDFDIEIHGDLYDGDPHLNIEVQSKRWTEKRIEELKAIFTEDAYMNDGDGGWYLIDRLAANMDLKPLGRLQSVRDFDVQGVRDGLNEGIDANMLELIRVLNCADINTDSCCGGHNDNRRPYIHFLGDRIAQMVSLLKAWKETGGIEYRIRPMGRLASSVRMEAPKEIPLGSVQEDLHHLTEFITSKVDGLPPKKVGFQALKASLSRNVRAWLGKHI